VDGIFSKCQREDMKFMSEADLDFNFLHVVNKHTILKTEWNSSNNNLVTLSQVIDRTAYS
jgi:hypothetical protein